MTLALVASRCDGVSLLRSAWTEMVLPPSCWTTGAVKPAFSTEVVTVSTETFLACTSQMEPPRKSIPRLSPRTPIAAIPPTMIKAEMVNQILRRPTKSNCVCPRYIRRNAPTRAGSLVEVAGADVASVVMSSISLMRPATPARPRSRFACQH